MVVDVYNVQLPQNAVDDNDVPRAGTAQGSEVSDFQQLLGLGQVHAQNAGKPQEHIPLRADLGVQDPVKGLFSPASPAMVSTERGVLRRNWKR